MAHSTSPSLTVSSHPCDLPPQQLSRPLRLAIQAEILSRDRTFVEFGETSDPADTVHFSPRNDRRWHELPAAWTLARQVLIVAAPVRLDGGNAETFAYADGILTPAEGTVLRQQDLKAEIDRALDVNAIPASLGIFFVFRDDGAAEQFQKSRLYSPQATPDDLAIYLALHPDAEIDGSIENPDDIRTLAHQLRSRLDDPEAIPQCAEQSAIGKKLPNALYIHQSALHRLDPLLRLYEAIATRHLGRIDLATLIKFSTDKPQISYLYYPDFDTDPHPPLKVSFQLDTATATLRYRDYDESDNPPILHRKETFVAPEYPNRDTFAALTRQEERCGLLKKRGIGTLAGWLRLLERRGLEVRDHQVVRRCDEQGVAILPKIQRHRAAIARSELSRPVRLALEAGLFREGNTFFDYGCGYGGDIDRVAGRGYASSGWDPYYRQDTPRTRADIVNLGYVINVIEDQAERRDALIEAWKLARRVLTVAAQVLIRDRHRAEIAYGDGVITQRNTFQKYYQQEELKAYIDRVLGVDAIPAGLGVFFAFRHEEDAEAFRASRYRSRTCAPQVSQPSKRYEDYQDLLAPMMAFMGERGRLPVKGELDNQEEILAEFGSFRRAFQLIQQATDAAEWEAIAQRRRDDFSVYLALTHFSQRPKRTQFAPEVKHDLKAFFGTLKNAFGTAEAMLFSAGNLDLIAECCDRAPVGKRTDTALYVHESALETLDPLLRIYEGCASRTIGRLEGVTAIKFHTDKPKISYLFYPDFDADPHPALQTMMQVDLRDLDVRYFDYDIDDNPPLLHCKHKLVSSDYPNYDKFAKLSRQEENWGLLDNPRAIHTRHDWLRRLEERCAELRGYRVYWRKDADPYRVKLIQSQRRARRKPAE